MAPMSYPNKHPPRLATAVSFITKNDGKEEDCDIILHVYILMNNERASLLYIVPSHDKLSWGRIWDSPNETVGARTSTDWSIGGCRHSRLGIYLNAIGSRCLFSLVRPMNVPSLHSPPDTVDSAAALEDSNRISGLEQ